VTQSSRSRLFVATTRLQLPVGAFAAACGESVVSLRLASDLASDVCGKICSDAAFSDVLTTETFGSL
jgi:hypothetical protein